MLPPLAAGLLPAGIHWAEWEEIVERFGTTAYRRRLLDGLREAAKLLAGAGCRAVYLDGSFVTGKEQPGDFDACWEFDGVDLDRLDPVLLDLGHPRAAQKTRFGGELFPNVVETGSGAPFLDFFQIDKETGAPKGIVAFDPRRVQ